ncbi:uncharacterized protein LOC126282480 [Schistocerca gregaria]|uniref:uncharacterized protein LOC126282480 n=1 Tax=Schistocerca gregaria TaxID=7010 RepID=UPI00211E9D4B|nr:uncharacterized protein LOC126282480 [Schistocerca gregaria]
MIAMQSRYKITSVVKSGAPLGEIVKNCEKLTKNSSVCVIIGGANDVYRNESHHATRALKETLEKLSHIKVFVLSVPHRHDLISSSCVNLEINKVNRKIRKLCCSFPQATFIDANSMERAHFTKHGMHRNTQGKEAMCKQLLNTINCNTVEGRAVIPLPVCLITKTKKMNGSEVSVPRCTDDSVSSPNIDNSMVTCTADEEKAAFPLCEPTATQLVHLPTCSSSKISLPAETPAATAVQPLEPTATAILSLPASKSIAPSSSRELTASAQGKSTSKSTVSSSSVKKEASTEEKSTSSQRTGGKRKVVCPPHLKDFLTTGTRKKKPPK